MTELENRWRVLSSCGHWWEELRPPGFGARGEGSSIACGQREHYQHPSPFVVSAEYRIGGTQRKTLEDTEERRQQLVQHLTDDHHAASAEALNLDELIIVHRSYHAEQPS